MKGWVWPEQRKTNNREIFMRIRLFTLAIIAGAMLSSCNKATPAPGTIDEVIFGHRPSSLFSAEAATKAVTATSLTSFKCEATTGSAGSESSAWNNVVFTSDGGNNYVASPAKYWPLDDPHYNFYAVAATASSGSAHDAVASNAPDLTFVNTGSTINGCRLQQGCHLCL